MTPTTTAELPEVTTLPQLDVAALRDDALTWLETTRAEAGGDPKRLLELFTADDQAGAKAQAECDAAVYTLLTGYRLRRGANLAGAIGTNRSGLAKVKTRTMKNPPKVVRNAPAVLARIAPEAKKHSIRREVSREARNTAAQALLDAGWTNADVARLMGRDPSRVSNIKHKESAA